MKASDKVLFICSLISKLYTTKCQIFSDSDIAEDACKHELEPILISAELGDLVVISIPIIHFCSKPFAVSYYLSDPNGDNTKLYINTTKNTIDYCEKTSNYSYLNDAEPIQRELFPVILDSKDTKVFTKHEIKFIGDFKNNNVVTIGPLTEDDHGNWVLSAYYKRHNDNWNEMFRVITVEIIESLPMYAEYNRLIPGQTFTPRFICPVNRLESCEIITPTAYLPYYNSGSLQNGYDRFYDRDKFHMDSCGFRIPNVTKHDEGIWTVIGVGKIVYRGEVNLEIEDENEEL